MITVYSFKVRKMNKVPAFTLLELLISITIFSGIMILALGIFGSAANSTVQSARNRNRTTAVRTIISQVNNDFRYLYTAQAIQECVVTNCTTYTGFRIGNTLGDDRLEMVLQYPGQSLIRKTYSIDNQTVSYLEEHDCTTSPISSGVVALTCTTTPSKQSILNSAYVVDSDTLHPVFSGQTNTSTSTGYLKMNLTIRAADVTGVSCLGQGASQAPGSACYNSSTTLVPGSYQ